MSLINPLLEKSSYRDGAVPFAQIKTEHFLPALDEAISIGKQNIEIIKDNSAVPNFDNVIVALETCSELVEKVTTLYFNLFSAEADEKMQALAKEISPKSAAFSNDIFLDEKLFGKIKSVYERRSSLSLTIEEQKLLEHYYQEFSRNGALLSSEKKEDLRKLDEELSKLSPKFQENTLKATNAFLLVIEDKADLAGVPETAVETAAQVAKDKGLQGKWVFTLQMPSVTPFLTYAENRALREKIYRAYSSRAFGGQFDNQETLKRIAELKHRRAQLLGYKHHADFVLEKRMAQTTANVEKFLDRLVVASKKTAEMELAELNEFAKKRDGIKQIMPWDFNFYSEKYKEVKFKFNEEDLRPYFKLENVVEGVFKHASKLYGLVFKPLYDVPVYHSEVKVFEVRDQRDDAYIGLFYADFFPRETKKAGAWMTSFREQGLIDGDVKRPHVAIVCNFSKPTQTKPSLLTLREVETLFHEFGHALHGLLSQCKFKSLGGTNVYWDFVELPSQIMENWVSEKEGLELFARHYETQQVMPDELIKKIKDSSKYLAGYNSLRQLSFGLLDWAWFGSDCGQVEDVESFEIKATERTKLLPRIPGTNISTAFAHIFGGGYSAGYYSYKWAEVLDADAFEFFQEKGIFNQDVAAKFREHILSRGGTEHPMELYKKFRGREPDPDALLRRYGMLS